MSIYIENLNTYLSKMKIKPTFISLKTGIDKNKLSHILTGKYNISASDMEKIANALGQKTEYFLSDVFLIPEDNNFSDREIAFYVGEPTGEQKMFALKLADLIENADEILSAKNKFMNVIIE